MEEKQPCRFTEVEMIYKVIISRRNRLIFLAVVSKLQIGSAAEFIAAYADIVQLDVANNRDDHSICHDFENSITNCCLESTNGET